MALTHREFTTTKRAQALPAKIGIPQMARMWNAYKAQHGIEVKPRAKTSCRSMSMDKCVDPCMWREAKGKKPAACYKPRVLSQQAKAKLRANLETARGMRRPKVLKTKFIGPIYDCKSFTTMDDCNIPCMWKKATTGKNAKDAHCYKPRGGSATHKSGYGPKMMSCKNYVTEDTCNNIFGDDGAFGESVCAWRKDSKTCVKPRPRVQKGAGMQHAGMNQNAGYWF